MLQHGKNQAQYMGGGIEEETNFTTGSSINKTKSP